MNYEFPIIKTIDDVLPAIEGRDEFVVADKGDYIVINYNVGFDDTFPPIKVAGGSAAMRAERSKINAMRRECRGIIFHPDGRIMSRPFNKFFNIGEREETLPRNIDMSHPHWVMEKMDGSMIRPIWVAGELRLGTKMGLTDTAILAEEQTMTDERREWMQAMMKQNVTPLFEFTSPDNRIVIRYDQPELTLLAMRVNETGEYLPIDSMHGNEFFPVVQVYGSIDGGLMEYIEANRHIEGREGVILSFGQGMFKIKFDQYVRIHRVKDRIRSDRHILALLLENELDDVYPHLDHDDFDRVKKYEKDFHDAYRAKSEYLLEVILTLVALADNKKHFATEILPNSTLPNNAYSFAFKMYDRVQAIEPGFIPREYMNHMMMEYVKTHIGSTVKYNEMAKWFGLEEQ